jgi:hypothetical protein
MSGGLVGGERGIAARHKTMCQVRLRTGTEESGINTATSTPLSSPITSSYLSIPFFSFSYPTARIVETSVAETSYRMSQLRYVAVLRQNTRTASSDAGTDYTLESFSQASHDGYTALLNLWQDLPHAVSLSQGDCSKRALAEVLQITSRIKNVDAALRSALENLSRGATSPLAIVPYRPPSTFSVRGHGGPSFSASSSLPRPASSGALPSTMRSFRNGSSQTARWTRQYPRSARPSKQNNKTKPLNTPLQVPTDRQLVLRASRAQLGVSMSELIPRLRLWRTLSLEVLTATLQEVYPDDPRRRAFASYAVQHLELVNASGHGNNCSLQAICLSLFGCAVGHADAQMLRSLCRKVLQVISTLSQTQQQALFPQTLGTATEALAVLDGNGAFNALMEVATLLPLTLVFPSVAIQIDETVNGGSVASQCTLTMRALLMSPALRAILPQKLARDKEPDALPNGVAVARIYCNAFHYGGVVPAKFRRIASPSGLLDTPKYDKVAFLSRARALLVDDGLIRSCLTTESEIRMALNVEFLDSCDVNPYQRSGDVAAAVSLVQRNVPELHPALAALHGSSTSAAPTPRLRQPPRQQLLPRSLQVKPNQFAVLADSPVRAKPSAFAASDLSTVDSSLPFHSATAADPSSASTTSGTALADTVSPVSQAQITSSGAVCYICAKAASGDQAGPEFTCPQCENKKWCSSCKQVHLVNVRDGDPSLCVKCAEDNRRAVRLPVRQSTSQRPQQKKIAAKLRAPLKSKPSQPSSGLARMIASATKSSAKRGVGVGANVPLVQSVVGKSSAQREEPALEHSLRITAPEQSASSALSPVAQRTELEPASLSGPQHHQSDPDADVLDYEDANLVPTDAEAWAERGMLPDGPESCMPPDTDATNSANSRAARADLSLPAAPRPHAPAPATGRLTRSRAAAIHADAPPAKRATFSAPLSTANSAAACCDNLIGGSPNAGASGTSSVAPVKRYFTRSGAVRPNVTAAAVSSAPVVPPPTAAVEAPAVMNAAAFISPADSDSSQSADASSAPPDRPRRRVRRRGGNEGSQ